METTFRVFYSGDVKKPEKKTEEKPEEKPPTKDKK